MACFLKLNEKTLPKSLIARLVAICTGLALIALGGYAFWLYLNPGSTPGITISQGTSSGTPLIGGDYELIDQNGATRRPDDFSGTYQLLYFGYTFCPDICPTSLFSMAGAIDLLEEQNPALAQSIVPLFITVDPERDTVQALKDYAPNFHDRLIAMTGSPEKVAEAAKAYRVFYAKVESEEFNDYLMDHSSLIFLMGPNGDYVSHFNHTATPQQIADGLVKFLDAS
ncbi:MAG: SCO family protein [Pseudomonadota bacterium]